MAGSNLEKSARVRCWLIWKENIDDPFYPASPYLILVEFFILRYTLMVTGQSCHLPMMAATCPYPSWSVSGNLIQLPMSSTQSSCCSLQSSSVGMEKSMIGIKRSFQFSAIRHSCGFTYFVNQNHVSATGQSQDYQVVEQNPFKGCPVHRGAQLDQPVTQLLRSIDLSASLRCSGISPVTTRIREVISNAFKTYFLSKWFFSTNHPLTNMHMYTIVLPHPS